MQLLISALEDFYVFLNYISLEMFQGGRIIIVWLSWLIGGICGVAILLIVICYCRLMPRHQKSLDEQYLKDNQYIKNDHDVCRMAYPDVHRSIRPVSYAGPALQGGRSQAGSCTNREHVSHYYTNNMQNVKEVSGQYASSSVLDEIEGGTSIDALKTRSLPAFLRPKQRPLSTEDDLQQLYAKVNFNKKYKNRMRRDHAAIIAISKSHSQYLDNDAVIVYDQRTAL